MLEIQEVIAALAPSSRGGCAITSPWQSSTRRHPAKAQVGVELYAESIPPHRGFDLRFASPQIAHGHFLTSNALLYGGSIPALLLPWQSSSELGSITLLGKMRTAIIVCSASSLASFAMALVFLFPREAEGRSARAHEVLERIAFRKDGTEELQRAVVGIREARTGLFLTRSLGVPMIWLSAGFSTAVLVLTVTEKRRKNA